MRENNESKVEQKREHSVLKEIKLENKNVKKEEEKSNITSPIRPKPRQELLDERLGEIFKELEATQVLIDVGNADTELRLKKKQLKKEKKSLEKKKRLLIRNRKNQAALRKRRKTNPVVVFRDKPGRPPTEEKVPLKGGKC